MKFIKKLIHLSTKKTFIKFIIYYLMMILLVTFLGGLSYSISAAVLENEVNNYNFSLIELTKQTMDERLNELNKMTYQITKNPRIIRLLNSEKPLSVDNRLDIHHFEFNEMRIYNALNSFSEFFFIYFSNLDIIVSPNAMHEANTFFKEIVEYSEYDYNTICDKILNCNETQKYIESSKVRIGKRWVDAITYSVSLPQGFKKHDGKIVFLINKDKFINIYRKSVYNNNTLFYIINSEKRVMVSSFEKYPVPDLYISDKKITNYKFNGVDSIIISIKSSVNDWTYNIVTAREIFFEKINKIKQLFILVGIITIVAGLFIALLMAYKNYKPLNDLVESIGKNMGDNTENINTEYKYIKESVLQAFNEASNLKSTVQHYKKLMVTHFLLRILKGEYQDKGLITEQNRLLELNLDYSSFSVILICVDFDSSSEQIENVLAQILSDTMENTEEVPFKKYNIELEQGKHIIIFCHGEENKKVVSIDINNFINTLKEQGLSKFNGIINMAAGSIVNDITMLRKSFEQAEANLRQNSKDNDNLESSSLFSQLYYYPMSFEKQFVNIILAGDTEEALNKFEEIYNINRKNRNLSFKMTQYFFFAIMNNLIGIIYETGLDISCNPLSRLSECNDVIETKEYIRKLLIDVVNKLRIKREINDEKGRDEVIEFIKKNYDDYNMCLEMISNKFDMSKPTVCRLIKDYTNEGFVDFLSKYRVDKAMELLKNSELLNVDIAEKCGFTSYNSFLRIFKKYSGVTPSQFRENIKNE